MNGRLLLMRAVPTDYWTSSLDEPLGLSHNTAYNLDEAAADDAWSFNTPPSSQVVHPGRRQP